MKQEYMNHEIAFSKNYKNNTFFDLYKLNSQNYSNITVDLLPLSTRLRNIFKKMKLTTAEDILNSSPNEFLKIPGFGKKCQKELVSLIENINGYQDTCLLDENLKYSNTSTRVDGSGFNVCLDLDEDLLRDLKNDINDPDEIKYLRVLASEIYKKSIVMDLYYKAIKKHDNILKNSAIYYLKCQPLKSTILNNDVHIKTLKNVLDYYMRTSLDDFEHVIKWLDTDYRSVTSSIVNNTYSCTRSFEMIIHRRIKGEKLAEIGNSLKITRERVRQIETKGINRIVQAVSFNQIIERIVADNNGEHFYFESEFDNYFGEFTDIILYSIERVKPSYLHRYENSKIIAIDSEAIESNIREFIESLPRYMSVNDENEILEKASLLGVRREILKELIKASYNEYGQMRTKDRLTLSDMYEFTLKKYYNDGLHVYDSNELNSFRKNLRSLFGNITLPSDRALAAAIIRRAVLFGRGTYKAKEGIVLSKELKRKIEEYIDKKQFVLMHTLFIVFKKELLSVGINNQYYLHGILREELYDSYYYGRDYISIGKEFSNLYEAICEFIRGKKGVVSRSEIKEQFPGITEIMITLATGNGDILNYFGNYIHIDNIPVRQIDIDYYDMILKKMIVKNKPLHVAELYEYIKNDNKEVMSRLGIFYPFSLFSFLKKMFGNEYEFARPYIAQKGTVIEKPLDQIREYINSVQVAKISEIIEIANNANYHWTGVINLIDSFNDTHFMIGKNSMQLIQTIGITEEDVRRIEESIGVIDTTYRIKDILWRVDNNYSFQLNEWLLYSAIKKWGKNHDVVLTSPFKSAEPLISDKGNMNPNDVQSLENEIRDENIDDIISDLIMEEFADDI